jgi:anti-anti-sigma regulatory factor
VITPPIQVHSCSHGNVTVVSPRGRLDLSTHVGLRDALLKAAADNPAALIVDADGLEVSSDVFLTLFAVVAGRIGDWPGIPLLLVATTPVQQTLLQAAPVRRVAPVHDSVRAALRACTVLVPYRYRRIHLPSSALSIVRARLFTTDVALAWDLPDMLDDVNQVVAELGRNVVQHAHTQMWIRLTERSGTLRVSVRNQCPVLPQHIAGGLEHVGRLSTQWGHNPHSGRRQNRLGHVRQGRPLIVGFLRAYRVLSGSLL